MNSATSLRIAAALLTLSLFASCDRDGKGDSSSVGEELKKAGEHLAEAGSIAAQKAAEAMQDFGDLLGEEWVGLKESAFGAKEELTGAYEQKLEEASRLLETWKEGAGAETMEALDGQIKAAQEKLTDLKGATAENWESAKAAAGAGWEELRDAFVEAEKAFKAQQEQNE